MLNSQSICVVRGSINCDEYFHVKHIVRPGETLSSSGHKRRVGGKGANQAVAIARAGGKVRFYGNVGKDGVWIKEAMNDWGIDVDGLLVTEGATGRAIIQVDEEGENSIILFPGNNHSALHEDQFQQKGGHWFPECSHLLLQNEIQMRSTHYALKNATNAMVFLNPSPLPSKEEVKNFPWDRVNWLIVNEDEARELAKTFNGTASLPHQAASEVAESLAIHPTLRHTNIICTLGAKGVLAVLQNSSDDQHRSSIEVLAGKVIKGVRDTTGAGDTFTGYFVSGIMELGPTARIGKDFGAQEVKKVLEICVQAAAMCVEEPGTIDSIPTILEVKKRL